MHEERWPSGRRRSPGERVSGYKTASWVQIPPSPPIFLEVKLRSSVGSVPCGDVLRTPPGPEGSNGKQCTLGAMEKLGRMGAAFLSIYALYFYLRDVSDKTRPYFYSRSYHFAACGAISISALISFSSCSIFSSVLVFSLMHL